MDSVVTQEKKRQKAQMVPTHVTWEQKKLNEHIIVYQVNDSGFS